MSDVIFENILGGFLHTLKVVWGEVWWIVTPIIGLILFLGVLANLSNFQILKRNQMETSRN
jgi:hypothetical protein